MSRFILNHLIEFIVKEAVVACMNRVIFFARNTG